MSAFGSIKFDSLMSCLDFLQPGFPPSAQQLARLMFSFSTFGLGQLEFSLFALDSDSFASLLSAQSFSHFDSVLFASDCSKPASSLSLQATSWVGFILLLFDAARIDLTLLVLDFLHIGFLLSVKSSFRLDFISLTEGILRLGPMTFVSDVAKLGLSLPLRSFT